VSIFKSITQSVSVSPGNSSNTNIVNGVTNQFVGIAESTLGVGAIQVTLKADRDCHVYIQQSGGLFTGAGTVTTSGSSLTGSGTDFISLQKGDEIYVSGQTSRVIATIGNDTTLTVTTPFSSSGSGLSYQRYYWDISDRYDFFRSSGNFGTTVQAVNSFARVIVDNFGASTTAYFRLQTCLAPMIEALPRSLNDGGNLKTSIYGIEDSYGFEVENTPMGEMRTVEPIRLVGVMFEGNTIDSNFWIATNNVTSGSGSVAQSSGEITLNSGTSGSSFATLRTSRRARYVSGTAQRYRAVVQLGDTGVANNKRRWGITYGATMPTITDGAWFQLSGTTFSVVTCKGSSETTVSSGSFNGNMSSAYAPDTNVATYEIYWTNSSVWFVIGGVVLHKVSANTATWSSTQNFYIYADNVNTGIVTNRTLKYRVASIYRLGKIETAPAYKYYHSAVTAEVLKIGPGRLHRVTFNTIPNSTIVTLYDAITATNPICIMNPPNGAVPFCMEFGLDFYNGLCVTTTPASCDITLIYE
jgi:hypothetical protein